MHKILLEAVNRGIKLALDNFDDEVPISQSINKVKSKDLTSEWLDLLNNFVDLGLPSSTLWAKYNLGCDWDKLNDDPEHTNPKDWCGSYFAWGETKPKKDYRLKTYKLFNNNNSTKYKFFNNDNLTKYNDKDKLTQLLIEDDAAYNYLKYQGYNTNIIFYSKNIVVPSDL